MCISFFPFFFLLCQIMSLPTSQGCCEDQITGVKMFCKIIKTFKVEGMVAILLNVTAFLCHFYTDILNLKSYQDIQKNRNARSHIYVLGKKRDVREQDNIFMLDGRAVQVCPDHESVNLSQHSREYQLQVREAAKPEAVSVDRGQNKMSN